MVTVRLHIFAGNPLDLDQFVVVLVHKGVIDIHHVGKATGHTSTEIVPGSTENGHQTAGHVLAAVIASAFHNRMGTGITNCETLARGSCRKELAASRTIQAGVADNGGFLALEDTAPGRLDHQLAAGHAFTDVVVGIALKDQVEAAHVPDTEALTSGAGKVQGNRRIDHTLVTVRPGNFARQTGTNGAVTVGYSIGPGTTTLFLDSGDCILNHLLREFTLVERMVPLYLTGLRLVRRNIVIGQQATEIQLLLALGIARQALQKVNATNQFFHAAHAQLRHPLAGFLSHKTEEIHGHFHRTLEVLFTEVFILGRNTGRAVVQVADTQVFAAQRHHWRGTEAEALGTQDRAFHHVQTGLDATIGLQADLASQVVGPQCLLGFGQAEFPGGAGITDGGQRACCRTTIVTRNGDQIGVGLGHTCGNGTDARLGDQLHRYQGLRIDLLEIEDQVGQILDRVDVVVRRRRNQRHTRYRITQAGDQIIDLATRQLTTLTGLGALGDLDLHDISAPQVFGSDPETTGSHLLDLGTLFSAIAGRIFTALTGVRATTQGIHGNSQGLVSLWRQGTQGHGRRIKAREDVLGRLNLGKFDGLEVFPETEKIPKGCYRTFVDQTGVLLVMPIVATGHRFLQLTDHIRIEGVILLAMDVFQ